MERESSLESLKTCRSSHKVSLRVLKEFEVSTIVVYKNVVVPQHDSWETREKSTKLEAMSNGSKKSVKKTKMRGDLLLNDKMHS